MFIAFQGQWMMDFKWKLIITIIAKAFDKMHHGTLMSILEDFGVTDLWWIESYLEGKKHVCGL